jgi:hypothetical protein
MCAFFFIPSVVIPVDDIVKKVIIPDLCQLEEGVQFRYRSTNTLKTYRGTQLTTRADHMEHVELFGLVGMRFLQDINVYSYLDEHTST